MVVNRPFYLVSRLSLGRVLQLNGARWLHIHRYVKGRTEQQFVFDSKSKTIISQRYKDRSIQIESNGNSRNVGMTTTNSRWW